MFRVIRSKKNGQVEAKTNCLKDSGFSLKARRSH